MGDVASGWLKDDVISFFLEIQMKWMKNMENSPHQLFTSFEGSRLYIILTFYVGFSYISGKPV